MKSRISTQTPHLTILYSGRNDKTNVRFSTQCTIIRSMTFAFLKSHVQRVTGLPMRSLVFMDKKWLQSTLKCLWSLKILGEGTTFFRFHTDCSSRIMLRTQSCHFTRKRGYFGRNKVADWNRALFWWDFDVNNKGVDSTLLRRNKKVWVTSLSRSVTVLETSENEQS